MFREALAINANDIDALYGYALSQVAQGRYEEAVEYLERCLERDPSYRDYQGWLQLASIDWIQGRRAEAIRRLEDLARQQNRIDILVTLADFYHRAGHDRETLQTLQQVFDDYDLLPSNIRSLYRSHIKKAKKLKKTI